MTLDIVIKAGRKGIAQRTHARVEARVFRTRQPWDFECLVESIFIEHLFAVHIGPTAQSENEVFLDAPEVIFRLSVGETEYSARVGAAKDMGDAVSVAIDRDVAGEGIRLREKHSLKCQKD